MQSVIELLAASPGLFIGTWLVLGLVVGSFLNVVIYRLPVMLDRQWREQCVQVAGEAALSTPVSASPRFNLIVPRSACPHCRAPITRPRRTFRCSRGWHCGAAAPTAAHQSAARYPLVEALTGVLTAAVAWKFGFGWPAGAAIVLTWFLVALAFIDIDHQLLPDTLTLPLLWLGLAFALWGPPARRRATGRCTLKPDRGNRRLRQPVERLSSVPPDHWQGRHGVR